MSLEKTDAIIIRLADFSESSRVVTMFTRDLGKVSALAKGAKRLKGPFDAAIDLLSTCRVVFLRKSSGALDILTEAQLIKRFKPEGKSLHTVYGGYYVAELLGGLTEDGDPHPRLFDEAVQTLDRLQSDAQPLMVVMRFELLILREIGQLPEFDACQVCGRDVESTRGIRFWVSQGGLVCSECGRPEYEHTEIAPGTIQLLRRMATADGSLAARLAPSPAQYRELRRVVTSAICHAMERRPKMLRYLK